MKKVEDFFTKTAVLLIAGIVAVSINVIQLMMTLFMGGISTYCIPYILYIVICLDLIISYKNGETSVQKTLMGALLVILVEGSLSSLLTWTGLDSGKTIGGLILCSVWALCYILVFVNHLLMQHDHSGRDFYSKTNQVILAVLLASYVAELFVFAFSAYEVFNVISMMSIVLLIVCMETRIQKYKRYRKEAEEAGNWNEETRKKAKKIFSFDVE